MRQNTCKTCGQKGHNSRTCKGAQKIIDQIQKITEQVQEVVKKVKDFNLNTHAFRLLQDEPFFAAISRRVNKVATLSIPTAGVGVDPKTAQFVLCYNPVYMAQLTDTEKSAILKHEFYHLILEHCTGRLPSDKSMLKMWNFATDLAINSYLVDQLPKGLLIPGEGKFKNYPPKQASEWYFSKLQQDKQFQKKEGGEGKGEGEGQDGEGEGQFDDHSKWGEGGSAASEIAKERLRDILKKAVGEVVAQGNRWGSVSAEFQKEILKRLSSSIDWTKVLRYFVRTSKRSSKIGTIRKVNKRYPYVHPGKKVTRHANIAISIDQSGSVGDEMLAVFFAELNNLSNIAEFTVIPFDSDVAEEKIFIWKKGQSRAWERVLCGGTDFNAPTKYVNEHHKFDGHIILTDLCAPKPVASKCNRMWVTTEECAANPYFQTSERIIAVKSKGG